MASLELLRHFPFVWHQCIEKRGPETEESIETLAQAFGLDARELSRQYVATMHTALALQKKGGLENRAAWVEALKHFEGRAAMRKKYPTDALKEAGKCIFFMDYKQLKW